MSYDSDRIAFYTKIIEEWSDTTPIRFDEVPDEDDVLMGADDWIRCYLEPSMTYQATLGRTSATLDRTTGQFIVEIYGRTGNGTAGLYRHADTIRGIFMGQHLADGRILVQRVSVMLRKPYRQWLSVVVSCGYTANDPVGS